MFVLCCAALVGLVTSGVCSLKAQASLTKSIIGLDFTSKVVLTLDYQGGTRHATCTCTLFPCAAQEYWIKLDCSRLSRKPQPPQTEFPELEDNRNIHFKGVAREIRDRLIWSYGPLDYNNTTSLCSLYRKSRAMRKEVQDTCVGTPDGEEELAASILCRCCIFTYAKLIR